MYSLDTPAIEHDTYSCPLAIFHFLMVYDMFHYYNITTIIIIIIIIIIIHLELIIGFAGDVSVSESENATLSITFSSAFATNFNINIGPPLNDSLLLIEGKSIMIIV